MSTSNPWTSRAPFDSANVALTGGNVGYTLASWDIPIVHLGSGSIGNNGALSGISALPLAYPDAFVTVPAGAIAAGVPATTETYYAQFSSTTAATIFNNTLASSLDATGAPTIPASPTAFVTTGPGAFTGIAVNGVCVTVTIPAGALGNKSEVRMDGDWQCTSAATNKTFGILFGGSTVMGITQTTITDVHAVARVKNRGKVTAQRVQLDFFSSSNTSTPAPTFLSINTANAVAVVYQMTKATATENLILEGGRITVYQL